MKEKLTIDVHERVNFTEEEKQKHMLAVQYAETVLNSKRFKELFLLEKLTSTEGLSNLEIYEKLISGQDEFNKIADSDIDVFAEMYYKNNSVVGYTNQGTCKTFLNRKFFKDYDPADVACNLVHEYLHKVGFDHTSAKEHTSVPYAIGYLVEKCIREMWVSPALYHDKDDVIEIEKPVETPKLPVPPVMETEPEEVKRILVCKRVWWTLWIKKICKWEPV